MVKIAIQGEKYSFHSIAAQHIFGNDIELIHCETFQQVFDSLKNKQAEHGVVALENSLYGSINDVYDLLLKYDFWISAEVYEQIGLHLFGTDQSTLETIRTIYSQAPALSEASEFLDKFLPKATRGEYYDTSAAAKFVAQSADKTKASISSLQAGQKNGLKALANNIETHSDNFTRFVAIQSDKSSHVSEKSDKTSISFATADKAGALYEVLGAFANADLNLTKLESRPIVGRAWTYHYYLDFEGSVNNEIVRKVLNKLSSVTTNLRILGCYPKGVIIHEV